MPLEPHEDDFVEDDWYVDENDSEIDGDCNESQPCRGDEPWLDQLFFGCKGIGKHDHEHANHVCTK